jgi:hypothetical protein
MKNKRLRERVRESAVDTRRAGAMEMTASITFEMSEHVVRACMNSPLRSVLRHTCCYPWKGSHTQRRGRKVRLYLYRRDTAILTEAVALFRAASNSPALSGRARCAMGRRRKVLLGWWQPSPIDLLASLEEDNA